MSSRAKRKAAARSKGSDTGTQAEQLDDLLHRRFFHGPQARAAESARVAREARAHGDDPLLVQVIMSLSPAFEPEEISKLICLDVLKDGTKVDAPVDLINEIIARYRPMS